MSTVHPKEADRIREIVRTVLGSGFGWHAGAMLIAMAVGGNLLSTFVLDTANIRALAGGVVLCLGVLWRVSFLSRRAEESLETVVATNEDPEKRKALVLFLSYPPKPEVYQSWMTDARFQGGIQSIAVHEAMDMAPWRMPVEAISYHFGKVQQIVVVCSGEANGTIHHYQKFATLLERLFHGKLEPPKYRGLHQLGGEWKGASGLWESGINFENANQLVAAMFEVFRFLVGQCKVPRPEVIIDVTGGTKVTTVAGAAVSLGKRQTFQYITQNHRICSYDVTYRREPE